MLPYNLYHLMIILIKIFTQDFYFIAVSQVDQIEAVSERLVNACTLDG